MASDGMRGVKAAESRICFLDGEKGILAYYGYDIRDLAEHATFEETCYLLLNTELPTAAQLAQFRKQLAKEYVLPEPIIRLILSLPRGANQMACLRTVLSALALHDPSSDDRAAEALRAKAVRLIAQTPVIVAALFRASKGLTIIDSDQSLSIAGNFLHCCRGDIASVQEERLFDALLTMHAEHSFNSSTFAARVTASTNADIYSAIVSAIGALKGPLHGGANLATLEQLRAIEATLSSKSPSEIAAKTGQFIDATLAKKGKIMGIGHAVYKVKDPRAFIIEKHVASLPNINTTQFAIAKAVESCMAKKKNLYPNVDLFSGIVYEAMGINAALFPSLFAMGRMPGWLAHIIEQSSDNKLIRPDAEYLGPQPRAFVPLGKRA